MHEERRGITYAVTAYVLWGFFPYYFSLLGPASALEIVAERVIWAFVALFLLLLLRRRWSWLRPLLADRRRMLLVVLGAAVMAVNWLTYNWAVNHDQAVEGALGYFINPLVTVLIGVVVLHERLRRGQWAAVAIAAVAVTVLGLDTGQVPWIALVLAVSFAAYGVAMKFVDTPPVEALTVGMGVMVVPFACALLVLDRNGTLVLGHTSSGKDALLIGAGVVTAVPMLFFNAAAPRVPLVVMGLLQYINPTMQFLVSVFILHETLSSGRWIGFVLVWIALIVFIVDGLRHTLRAPQPEAPELNLA